MARTWPSRCNGLNLNPSPSHNPSPNPSPSPNPNPNPNSNPNPNQVGLEEVKADIEAYVASCALFEANPNPNPILTLTLTRTRTVTLTLTPTLALTRCALFEEYMGELDKLANEDWISFRQRLWEVRSGVRVRVRV